MRPRNFLIPTSFAVLLWLSGCAGSNGPVAATQTLSGVIDTTTFKLPAGESRRVSGNLRINATEDIILEGTLLVDEGVEITLDAQGKLEIGEVMPSGIVAPSGRGDTLVDHIFVGQRALTSANQQWPANTSLNFLCRGQGELTVNGDIALRRSSSGARAADGTPGGSIQIGTAEAIALAAMRKINGVSAPKVLTVAASLTAGAGGHGGDEVAGVAKGTGGRDREFVPGSGAPGGSVNLQATTLKLNSGTLTPGDGGDAGWGGRAHGTTSGFAFASHGTGDSEIGGDCLIAIRRGGDAGKATLTGAVEGTSNIAKAHGGQLSSFFCGPGNGGPNGVGGSLVVLSVNVEAYDSEGHPEPQTNIIHVLNAGNGGQSTRATSHGGAAGNLRAAASQPYLAKSLKIVNSFRGGPGFDGCASSPKGPGSNGGPGGSLDRGTATYTLEQSAFSGGDAGDYMNGTATRGGSQGRLTSGDPISRPGFDGYPCSVVDQTFIASHDIKYGSALLVKAGTPISVKRFRGFHYAGPEGGCGHFHLHGIVYFDGVGPIPDPDPTGCGHAHAQ